jgi:hypothetical protein
VPRDVLDNSSWDAIADLGQGLDQEIDVGVANIGIWKLVSPLLLHPSPDGFDGVEEGGSHRQKKSDCAEFL